MQGPEEEGLHGSVGVPRVSCQIQNMAPPPRMPDDQEDNDNEGGAEEQQQQQQQSLFKTAQLMIEEWEEEE